MYSQRPKPHEIPTIRKISPKSIASNVQTPPCTQENWQHLVNIVMRLVQDKQIKDSVVSDLASRMENMETTLDNSTSALEKKTDCIAPMSDTFTMKSIPAFLRGRLRRSYALISKPAHSRATRRSSYRLTFHQYLGVPGLGIGVSRGKNHEYRHHSSEEILFISPNALEILVTSIAGEKERKLPDLLLKYLQLEKREFVRDWMRGYINLEKEDDEFVFSVDLERGEEKEIWIEYVGMFDGMGRMIVENKLGSGKCGDTVVDVSLSRTDLVI
jgi:hypothetical protein